MMYNEKKQWKADPNGRQNMERKSYISSDHTKHALATALKELMVQKPLDKITIQELTNRCGMRRQNFYYHFEDVYDLLRWLFQEEAVSLLRQHEGALLWQDGLLQLYEYLEETREFCLCALKSVGRDHIRRFVEADIYAIIHRTVDQIGEEIGILKQVRTADADLVTHFYVVAMAGMTENWLTGQIERTPQELIAFVDQILQDHVRGVKQRLAGAAEE